MSIPPADTHASTHEAKVKASSRRRVDDSDIVLYWLSFNNPDTGEWLGCCIVPAPPDDFITAVKMSHHFKANPGGQVAWIEKPNLEKLPRRLLARLLNRDEAAQCEAIIAGGMQ